MPATRGPWGSDTCLTWVLLSEQPGETCVLPRSATRVCDQDLQAFLCRRNPRCQSLDLFLTPGAGRPESGLSASGLRPAGNPALPGVRYSSPVSPHRPGKATGAQGHCQTDRWGLPGRARPRGLGYAAATAPAGPSQLRPASSLGTPPGAPLAQLCLACQSLLPAEGHPLMLQPLVQPGDQAGVLTHSLSKRLPRRPGPGPVPGPGHPHGHLLTLADPQPRHQAQRAQLCLLQDTLPDRCGPMSFLPAGPSPPVRAGCCLSVSAAGWLVSCALSAPW